MAVIYAALWATAVFTLIFLVGYVAGRRQADGELVARVMRYKRREAVQSLRTLRGWLETAAGGVSAEQAFLLTDVCSQLGFSEAETQGVVGAAYWMVVDAPADLPLLAEE